MSICAGACRKGGRDDVHKIFRNIDYFRLVFEDVIFISANLKAQTEVVSALGAHEFTLSVFLEWVKVVSLMRFPSFSVYGFALAAFLERMGPSDLMSHGI